MSIPNHRRQEPPRRAAHPPEGKAGDTPEGKAEGNPRVKPEGIATIMRVAPEDLGEITTSKKEG
jgi:hypothetical protein